MNGPELCAVSGRADDARRMAEDSRRKGCSIFALEDVARVPLGLDGAGAAGPRCRFCEDFAVGADHTVCFEPHWRLDHAAGGDVASTTMPRNCGVRFSFWRASAPCSRIPRSCFSRSGLARLCRRWRVSPPEGSLEPDRRRHSPIPRSGVRMTNPCSRLPGAFGFRAFIWIGAACMPLRRRLEFRCRPIRSSTNGIGSTSVRSQPSQSPPYRKMRPTGCSRPPGRGMNW